jgi:hypothetical protein
MPGIAVASARIGDHAGVFDDATHPGGGRSLDRLEGDRGEAQEDEDAMRTTVEMTNARLRTGRGTPGGRRGQAFGKTLIEDSRRRSWPRPRPGGRRRRGRVDAVGPGRRRAAGDVVLVGPAPDVLMKIASTLGQPVCVEPADRVLGGGGEDRWASPARRARARRNEAGLDDPRAGQIASAEVAVARHGEAGPSVGPMPLDVGQPLADDDPPRSTIAIDSASRRGHLVGAEDEGLAPSASR